MVYIVTIKLEYHLNGNNVDKNDKSANTDDHHKGDPQTLMEPS